MSNSTALTQVANRLSVSEEELRNIVMTTIMPSGGRQVSNEQFVSFLAVANEYQLNPLVKEIYAFPGKGGGIQPIVSIDGWLKIINTHPAFDGMEHEDIIVEGKLFAIKCSMYRKDTSRPVSVTEYMSECAGTSEPWRKYPARMLRHKATIQAGRYAFGISGIIDPDEEDRFADAGAIEKVINPTESKGDSGDPIEDVLPPYSQDRLNKFANRFANDIQSGASTPESIIEGISAKYILSADQIKQINELNQEQAA